MPITLLCHNCSTKYRLKDSSAGKSITCKQCGTVLSVPGVASDGSGSEVPSSPRALSEDELAPEGWVDSRKSRPAAAPISAELQEGSLGLKIWRFVLSMLFLATVLLAGLWIGGIVLEGKKSSSWPTIDGTVVRSEMVRAGKGSRLDLRYHYRVNDVSYDSERVTVVGKFAPLAGGDAVLHSLYPESAGVRVYYDPTSPESAVLQPGVPLELGFLILLLFLIGILSTLFVWSSCAELFGAPRPMVNPDVEDPRSIPQRCIVAFGGGLIVLACVGFAMLCLSIPRSVPQHSRDGFTMMLSFLAFALAMFPLLGVWFGIVVFKSAFKRPETINDLRNAPDSPKFSTSSLVCFSAGLGSSTAVIVDHDKGMIHFKKCFTPRERAFFSGLTAPWWSCKIDCITGLSQMAIKGGTIFRIETEQGNVSVSPLIENFAELRHYLENRLLERTKPVNRQVDERPKLMLVKTTSAMGGKPLDWRVALCVLGAVFGPIVGLIIGATVGSRDLGSYALWGIILGGCSGLPFFAVTAQQLGRFVVSVSGITTCSGIVGVLVYFALKLFIQTQFIDLVVLAGAGALLGFLFARQREK